ARFYLCMSSHLHRARESHFPLAELETCSRYSWLGSPVAHCSEKIELPMVGKIAASSRRCRLMPVATPAARLLPFCLTWLSNPRRLEAQPRVPPGFSRWQS